MKSIALSVLLFVFYLGCGASTSTTNTSASNTAEDAPTRRAQAIQRLDARQQKACHAMCPRLTECVVADAKKNISPEKLKDGPSLEQLAPLHTAKCNEECTANPLSLRQIRVYEDCTKQKQLACGPLVDCLEQAQPQKSSK